MERNWLPGRTVLWEFPDVETVKTWDQSEEYGPLLKLRSDISDGSIILITDGVMLLD
ncbi:MAG: DUF1330 domain-containing protein [Nitrospirae bacterium]|nr:DUF1330 domain-containing protein [Nitrospirota bacterium]MDA1303853.1 DUF1330 domain-containing protein [Nitrospirota bacterium]